MSFYQGFFHFVSYKDQIEDGPFIEDVLGIRNAKLRTVKLKSTTSEVMVELIEYQCRQANPNENRINNVGPTHLAFQVKNIDDLYQNMADKGVEFISAPRTSPDNFAKVAFCRAPEGTYVELVELLAK